MHRERLGDSWPFQELSLEQPSFPLGFEIALDALLRLWLRHAQAMFAMLERYPVSRKSRTPIPSHQREPL